MIMIIINYKITESVENGVFGYIYRNLVGGNMDICRYMYISGWSCQ